MAVTATAVVGRYGPLTKSIDIDEALTLVALTREYPGVAAWRQEARMRLSQASLKRRQEIVHAVQAKFLVVEGDCIVVTPLLILLRNEGLPARLRRDLLLGQYLRSTSLVWEALRDLVLPRAESSTRGLGKAQEGEITVEDWTAFLAGRLTTSTPSTAEKTRNHITAHLTKFGLLEARAVPGDRIAKRFFARFYEPDVRAFWFSLATEFNERGWTSRSLDYVTGTSWTRVGYGTTPAFARYAVEEAEAAGLVVTNFFGSEKQVTLAGPDAISKIVAAIIS